MDVKDAEMGAKVILPNWVRIRAPRVPAVRGRKYATQRASLLSNEAIIIGLVGDLARLKCADDTEIVLEIAVLERRREHQECPMCNCKPPQSEPEEDISLPYDDDEDDDEEED